MTTNLPSVKQMLNRANSGHRQALLAVAEQKVVLGPTASLGAYRGMRTVFDTLRRWEAIEAAEGDYNVAITARGRDLLAALTERHDRSLGR